MSRTRSTKAFILGLVLASAVFGWSFTAYPTADAGVGGWNYYPVSGSAFSKLDEPLGSGDTDYVYTLPTSNNWDQSVVLGSPTPKSAYGAATLTLSVRGSSYPNAYTSSTLGYTVTDKNAVVLGTGTVVLTPSTGNYILSAIQGIRETSLPLTMKLSSPSSCTITGGESTCNLRVFSVVASYNITSRALPVQ